MKTVRVQQVVSLPEGVNAAVNKRVVTIKGKRGELKKSFSHLQVDITMTKNGRAIAVEMWFGNKKELACVRTICSHIRNMITGVTKGFEFKMKFVYAHFPINVNITDESKRIEVRNFLGEKVVRSVNMLDGVVITRDDKVKDQIVIVGNDLENVSQSAASIHQSCLVKEKDIRKFLDGIYVSERGYVDEDA